MDFDFKYTRTLFKSCSCVIGGRKLSKALTEELKKEDILKRKNYVEINIKNMLTSKSFHIAKCKCTPFEETRFVKSSCTRYITLLFEQTPQMIIFLSFTTGRV